MARSPFKDIRPPGAIAPRPGTIADPAESVPIGTGEAGPRVLSLRLANRHGLVAGATGTGKTVTLQTLAEGFSRAGVPVVAADIKGDLSGIAAEGSMRPAFVERARSMDYGYEPDRFPVVFWDLFGEQGHPVRATVTEMGPLLLSRLLGLNETQEGVLNIAFRLADEQSLPLVDLKDLRALLQFVSENAAELTASYGNIAAQSVGAIQRALLVLENQGAANFFGEPALEIADLMRTDTQGRGIVNIFAADRLMANPRLYAVFLLWLVSELFEELPEVGDPDKPRLVFFFDEAHLLFNDAPKHLLEAVEQVVRLIRSKGVGIYFVTQNPLDVPESVLAQLGNRVQHALRAFTPRDQKAVRAAAETFRANPHLDTVRAITELEVGEALVSTLEGRGVPGIVERVQVRPPAARVGPITPEERRAVMAASPLLGKYDTPVDNETAYEILQKRRRLDEETAGDASASGGIGGLLGGLIDQALGTGGGEREPAPARGRRKAAGGRPRMTTGELILRNASSSIARTVGSGIGRAIVRGVLGGMLK